MPDTDSRLLGACGSPRTPVAPGSSSALSITRCTGCLLLVAGATLLFHCMHAGIGTIVFRRRRLSYLAEVSLSGLGAGAHQSRRIRRSRLTPAGNKQAVPRFRLHPNSGICPRGSTSPSTSSTFHLFHACRAGAENVRRAPSRRRYSSYPSPLRWSIPPGCSTRFIICPP